MGKPAAVAGERPAEAEFKWDDPFLSRTSSPKRSG